MRVWSEMVPESAPRARRCAWSRGHRAREGPCLTEHRPVSTGPAARRTWPRASRPGMLETRGHSPLLCRDGKRRLWVGGVRTRLQKQWPPEKSNSQVKAIHGGWGVACSFSQHLRRLATESPGRGNPRAVVTSEWALSGRSLLRVFKPPGHTWQAWAWRASFRTPRWSPWGLPPGSACVFRWPSWWELYPSLGLTPKRHDLRTTALHTSSLWDLFLHRLVTDSKFPSISHLGSFIGESGSADQ